MKFFNLINRTLESNFYKKQISSFFKEVADDIKIINYSNPYYNNSNQVLTCFYQDSDCFDDGLDDEINIKIKEITAKKYKEKYCPTCLFDYFNRSEKAQYLMLRAEIDKILREKSPSYKL
jgi:hypothetical protein